MTTAIEIAALLSLGMGGVSSFNWAKFKGCKKFKDSLEAQLFVYLFKKVTEEHDYVLVPRASCQSYLSIDSAIGNAGRSYNVVLGDNDKCLT